MQECKKACELYGKKKKSPPTNSPLIKRVSANSRLKKREQGVNEDVYRRHIN